MERELVAYIPVCISSVSKLVHDLPSSPGENILHGLFSEDKESSCLSSPLGKLSLSWVGLPVDAGKTSSRADGAPVFGPHLSFPMTLLDVKVLT